MKLKSTKRKLKKKAMGTKCAPKAITKTQSNADSDKLSAQANTMLLMTIVSVLALSLALYSMSIFYLLWK